MNVNVHVMKTVTGLRDGYGIEIVCAQKRNICILKNIPEIFPNLLQDS
jgi:hypothetical protein